jgi:hypothetical protein
MVLKKDGLLRVAQNFKELNAASQDDRYSMKTVNECADDVGRTGSTIFSTLGFTCGI